MPRISRPAAAAALGAVLCCALAPGVSAQQPTAVELFRQAHELQEAGCTLKWKGDHGSSALVEPKHRGGHRRQLQLGMGNLFDHASTCDVATLQDRAAAVDSVCCSGDSCDGGIPTSCTYACAVEFVPFFSDCAGTLSSIGHDMSSVNELCTPRTLSTIRKAVERPTCPNAILSCSKGATCVDANSGGGATPAELAACERWTRDGGRGWQPSGEPCGGITGNLITNGGFEEPAITDGAVDCQGGHDSSFRGDDHCQYKYVFPTVSEFCHSSCSVPGWFVGTRAPSDDTTTPATYVALAENGNAPWGGLDSHMGTQYLVLEGSGAYIQQTVHGLSRGQVYELRLRMANRPGYGDDETLVIKMDNHIIGESNHPTDDFSEYGVAFTARGSTAVLQIENDTPNDEDCSVFIDEVTITEISLGQPVRLVNANFDVDELSSDGQSAGYEYMTPQGWSGNGVVVASGAAPWGSVTAAGGRQFLALQGLGSYVEQPLLGLTTGTTYCITFWMTDRPGYGEDESLHVKVDSHVVWESTHPEDGFTQYSAVFTAEEETSTLRFENDSPEGDRSVFIDMISIAAATNALQVVLPASSAEAQPYDFQLLSTPMTFADAEAECVRRNRHLASIHSMEENMYVAAMHHAEDAAIYDGVYIGGQDASDGTTSPWTWTDGTEFDWHNWGPDEPNNGRTNGSCDENPTEGCGENCAIMSAHLSQWSDHSATGGGNEGNDAIADYQWNDGGCDSMQQAVCGVPSSSGSRTLLAYYSFDDADARDVSGNHRNGVVEGNVQFPDTGVSGKAAHFDGASRIVVSAFRQYAFGSRFAVSTWFLRDPTALGNYMGIVNNGYYTNGGFEIRMGREMGGTMLGGGVITAGHSEAWDVVSIPATVNVWQHACLVYDSDTVHFYLDGRRTVDEADHGDIVTRNTDLFIGQAGTGSDHEYFTGLIDEVKIFSRALAHEEVLDIFRSTPHNGGHCENRNQASHCNADGRDSGDGDDYCDAVTVRQVVDLGAAMGTLDRPDVETSMIAEPGSTCNLENALLPDGQPAGIARVPAQRAYAVWDGHAVTACIEMEWEEEMLATGIKFAAASSDEDICAGDSCSGEYCGTNGDMLVYVSGSERANEDDYTTFYYQGSAQLPIDTAGHGNGFGGQMNFDELTFEHGEQAVRYIALCRGGSGGGRDNLIIDWVSLRVSAANYAENSHNCNPRPPPPPPPANEGFVEGIYFFANSYDGQSWNPERAQAGNGRWLDIQGRTGSAGTIRGAHFVNSPLPKHFQFDGSEHFVFDQPQAFDFTGDFTVTVLVRLPPDLEPYHLLLSRRDASDYLCNHQIFIDTRSTWATPNWIEGEPVAVLYLGGGDGSHGVWAHTAEIAVGDYAQLTFTVQGGRVCGYVNGHRSGDCSAQSIVSGNRQVGSGEPLEVGGEDSYSSHPLWSLASVLYYDRALNHDEVMANYEASLCLELESSCP